MNMKINDRHGGLTPYLRFNSGTVVSIFLANPTMVLVELGMFRIELMSIKIVTITDAAVTSYVIGG